MLFILYRCSRWTMKNKSHPFISIRVNKLLFWLVGIVSIAACMFLLLQMAIQFVVPAQKHHLQLVRDIPLPSALPDHFRSAQNPTALGAAVLFDHFDFQALDEQAHLLFIAHSGPSPDREQQVNP